MRFIRLIGMRGLVVCLVLVLVCATVQAEGRRYVIDERSFAACLLRAAKHYRLPPKLLLAIKLQESGHMINGGVTHRNQNGTYDIGPMQINSAWLKRLRRYGIDEAMLRNPCINVYVGAWILRNEIDRHGLVSGIAHYHSPTPKHQKRYLKHLIGILKSLKRM